MASRLTREYAPLEPNANHSIVCIGGSGGDEFFYCNEQGDVATLISNFKEKYKKITGFAAVKVAVYNINSITTSHIIGINL
ncbi:MAG: hypothetical protein O2893_03955 [Cyanobacteria bacterium]|jgi:hypothetical protein|nr:hypothetical protein [Cyanobacteriota bacterium]MDA1170296.1 hypothetical protein [Cyanobacteriota bacterium]